MESDRELLELAAKAAGFDDAKFQDMSGWGEVRYGLSCAIWSETHGEYWNPLTDDGDALRLVVSLRLCVSVTLDGVSVSRSIKEPLAWERTGVASDEIRARTATRRAIVRAAAEIGRAM